MKKIISLFISLFLYLSISFADNGTSLIYIIPDDEKHSIIDTNAQKKLSFKLYKTDTPIYYNHELINLDNEKFEIDISKMSGIQTFTFTSEGNKEISYTYYLCDETGLVQKDNLDLYVTTVDSIKIIYTLEEEKTVKKVINLIKNIPTQIKSNISEITFNSATSPLNAAGTTDYNKITFYKLSSFKNSQLKNIVYHEIAHTWAYELAKAKKMDLTCKIFSKASILDNNFVSNYSKNYIKKANNYTEDFAESVAFYLINSDNFTRKYPNRAAFINQLIDF